MTDSSPTSLPPDQPASAPPPVKDPPRRSSRSRLITLGIAAVVIGFLAVGAVAFWPTDPPPGVASVSSTPVPSVLPDPSALSDPTPVGSTTPSPQPTTSPSPIASSSPSIAPEPPVPSDERRLKRVTSITGGLAPKSVVATQTGLFFAQNMMYRHTMTVYDRTFTRVKTIRDNIVPANFGFPKYSDPVRGSPVEAAVAPSRNMMYVSQYTMFGPGFNRLGRDHCYPSDGIDRSFVYGIDLTTLRKKELIRVGSTPKYLAVTPDGARLLVSNWCSYDLSVVDLDTGREIQRIPIGPNPRGIAVSPDSRTAYVTVMASRHIAIVDLETFRVRWIRDVGLRPRHLVMDPQGEFLYASLDGANQVIKIDLATRKIVDRVSTGEQPRTMDIAPDGRSLYVVNYTSGTVSKIETRRMRVLQTLRTAHHPVGLTYDVESHQLWVACYSGVIIVFEDRVRGAPRTTEPLIGS